MNLDEPDLLPCPFCGGRGRMAFSRDGEDARIMCEHNNWSCLGSGPWKPTRPEAITAWNTRVPAASGSEAPDAGDN